MAGLDFKSYAALTFDCYGTLIDWESGILGALGSVLTRHGIVLAEEEILSLYADLESQIEAGPYMRYRDVLREVMHMAGEVLAFDPLPGEWDVLAESLAGWLPFPDTAAALAALKKNYRLGVISNIDDDLFTFSARRLGVVFDWVVTAEQAGSYKPSRANFELAFDRMKVPRSGVLHVAQSIYHDIVPAGDLGLATVWVNRRAGRPGFGATPAAAARADVEVTNLQELVDLIGG